MTMRTVKRLAADILNVGVNRVRVLDEKKALSAATREDVRQLIADKVIVRAPIRGRRKKEPRKRKGPGRRKGTPNARKPLKEQWMERVRALRKYLRALVNAGNVPKEMYRALYMKIKGNQFRGKRAFLQYLKDTKIYKE